MTKIKDGCKVGASKADAPMGAPKPCTQHAPNMHPSQESPDQRKRQTCTQVHPRRTHDSDLSQKVHPCTPVSMTGAWVHPAGPGQKEN
jgi:hypothetical protein